jgi:hypothetical protein
MLVVSNKDMTVDFDSLPLWPQGPLAAAVAAAAAGSSIVLLSVIKALSAAWGSDSHGGWRA